MTIDDKILLAQLNELGAVGKTSAGGRTRLALSDADKAGRDLVTGWMRELDLEIRIDRIGNIFGILNPELPGDGRKPALSPVMVGSHIDTVANAGMLDGCYGVLSGLAVVRAIRQSSRKLRRPLVVAAFTNEEGVRYQPDMVGSLVYCGGYSLEEALNAAGTDGSRFGDELERIGYAGDLEPGSMVPKAYIELHVEQGPVLDAEKLDIGVVENLQGISWQKITVRGTANHAGTTPTDMRRDAGCAAAQILLRLRELALESGTTRVTVGTMAFEPNQINVIPGQAVFTIDLRDPDEGVLCAAEARVASLLEETARKESVEIAAERLVRFQPVAFDPELVGLIESEAERAGFSRRRMTSGAGHDAQMMARICPTAMIFVPSRDGISHNPAEYTDEKQLIRGTRLLAAVVERCLDAE